MAYLDDNGVWSAHYGGARGETNAAVRHLQRALDLQLGDPLVKQELDLLLTSTDPAK